MNSMKQQLKILPAGDMALVADFGNEIGPENNESVKRLSDSLRKSDLPGIITMVPTYRSLLIYYEPSMVTYEELSTKVRSLSEHESGRDADEKKKVLHIPVCYGNDYGEDLGDMEKLTGLSKKDIIDIHSGPEYRIYMLGFLPGFVYLGGLDERIHAARLASPRVKIPKGSVAIGGAQTGVYPVEAPGGWRLIGRTPVMFYDPEAEKPILCHAGEFVKFEPVSEEEYKAIERDTEAKRYKVEVTFS